MSMVAVFVPPLVINDDQLVTVLAVKLRSPKGAFYAAKAKIEVYFCRGINSRALLLKSLVVPATKEQMPKGIRTLFFLQGLGWQSPKVLTVIDFWYIS